MEWLLTSALWGAFTGWHTSLDPTLTPPTPFPTELDLSLITLVYEVAAGEANCPTCDAPLGRRPQLATRRAGQTPAWPVVVTTRCRGWRRHRHTAVVTETSGDLRLGPLRPNRTLVDGHV